MIPENVDLVSCHISDAKFGFSVRSVGRVDPRGSNSSKKATEN